MRKRSNQTLKYFKFFIKRIPDLSGKEKEILLKRLCKTTLNEIGKTFSVTEGRVRQIESSALEKLKSKSHQLALFAKLQHYQTTSHLVKSLEKK